MLMRGLSHFVALATQKRFVRAAETRDASRKISSASIRELEKYLEARLVTREGDSIHLTLQGEAALVWARRILADHEAMPEQPQPASSSYEKATDRLALNKP